MSTIAILTSSFPFSAGEQFLETEIEYWKASGEKVLLLPATAGGSARETPDGIIVDLTLAKTRSWVNKFACLLAAPATRLFRDELAYLRSVGNVTGRTIYQAARSVSRALLAERGIKRTSRKYGGLDLVYTYWNDDESCGAVLAKRHGHTRHAISRAHRYDLYEESRPNGYLPLKRQYIHELDAVFPISESGRQYMAATYGATASRLIVSRLGVALPGSVARISPPTQCHLVSVSSCTAVKRVDKIIDAISLVALRMPTTSFYWTHVGGGPLLLELEQFSRSRFGDLPNVVFVFTGPLPHYQVLSFLQKGTVDLFINTSESEGIPVSIMEAMSLGIPSIAPDVGAVSEVILEGTGILMSPDPSTEEIASHLGSLITAAKHPTTRALARELVATEFNAELNYVAFVALCSKIAAS